MKNLKQIIFFIWKHPLAGRHPLRSFFRFFYWQLIQLAGTHTRSVRFIGDTRLLMRKGLTGATGNYYTGLHEFQEMAFLIHLLRRNDLFADVGANIGSYTILASGYCEAKTMAFEPVPKTFRWLTQNIAVNKICDRVFVYNQGIASVAGQLDFSSSGDTVNYVLTDQNTIDAVKVEVNTLEYFVQVHGMPLLIKVDVEGYETEVIKGLRKFIFDTSLKAIIIELNGLGWRYGYDEQKLHKYLLDAGFIPYTYEPFKRNLSQSSGIGRHNTIYIRDIDFVETRIKTASPIKIFGESF
ncbi:MAG TPA: FkbM family methyltransferase [Chitinophagaceae bacterium]|nr:FkbM family methyltransferase [Chitinophagaceae bacterium]